MHLFQACIVTCSVIHTQPVTAVNLTQQAQATNLSTPKQILVPPPTAASPCKANRFISPKPPAQQPPRQPVHQPGQPRGLSPQTLQQRLASPQVQHKNAAQQRGVTPTQLKDGSQHRGVSPQQQLQQRGASPQQHRGASPPIRVPQYPLHRPSILQVRAYLKCFKSDKKFFFKLF